MLVPKSLVSLFTVVVVGTGAALAWQVHTSGNVNPAAAGDWIAVELRGLEHQVAAQSRKLAEAEERVSALLKKADAIRAGHRQPARPGGPSPKPDGPIDTNEIARVAAEKGRSLMKEGRLQEALALYLATYREVQPLRPGSPACQKISGEMKYLGRSFPPALVALAQLRDEAMDQLPGQAARRGELSFEIALLNERLSQGAATLALFEALPAGDIHRGSLAMVARAAFIQAGRYTDALLGKPFGQMLVLIDSGAQHLGTETDPARQAMIRTSIIEETATNIEVLAGAGKSAEAEQLTNKLLAFDSSPASRRLIEQHVARAAGRKP